MERLLTPTKRASNTKIANMKTIYFLRHGQTDLNKKSVHQSPSTPLSERGREQAHAIAEKIKELPIDVIVTSPYERTYETAEIVNKMNAVPLQTYERFTELRKPSELEGTSWFSPKSLWVMGQLYFRVYNKKWHYSDEENLSEFQQRAFNALQCLANRPEQNILVVTHRGLMANLQSCMKNDGLTSVGRYRRALWKNMEIGNCCLFKTSWSADGEYGDTLDGTWDVETGYTCPDC